MSKKILYATLLVTLILAFTACGADEPSYVETIATKDQTPEPEQTPESHVHRWAYATCQSPQTCTECGETQGNPLPHELTAASFQEPPICVVCGEVGGEPLMPYFRENGIAINLQVGVLADYVSIAGEREDLSTIGTLTITDYQIVPYTETFEAKDGFEWRILNMRIVFTDANANAYGSWTSFLVTDYFTGWTPKTGSIQTVVFDGIDDDAAVWEMTMPINYRGNDYEVLVIVIHHFEWIVDYGEIREGTWALRVPIGYDGAIMVYHNAAIRFAEEVDGLFLTVSERTDGNSLFFRLN